MLANPIANARTRFVYHVADDKVISACSIFYVNAIPKSESPIEAIASVFSVICNIFVPYGITTPNESNISSTRWRPVPHHKRKLYFFKAITTPNIFWANLTKVDFTKATGKVMKLDLGFHHTHIYSGMANKKI